MNRKLNITELNRLSPDEYQLSTKTPLYVVLDNVRSLHNVGSIFRTADAFLLEGIYLCGITSVPPNAEIHKTALGAEHIVPWKYFENTLEAVLELKANGYEVYSVEQTVHSIPLTDWPLPIEKKTAIVLGNEVKGVQQEVINICAGCIEIPQLGTKHSLNVSVSGAIVIWEIFKRYRYGLEK